MPRRTFMGAFNKETKKYIIVKILNKIKSYYLLLDVINNFHI